MDLALNNLQRLMCYKIKPNQIKVYLVKKRGAIDNNYRRQWLMGIRLQDSAFLSEVVVNHLMKARGEIWPKHREEETTQKNYQDEVKKSAINKKINSQIKKPHLKIIPIKRQFQIKKKNNNFGWRFK